MTPGERLLASLAVAMAPDRAAPLLSRLGSAGARLVRAHAERLVPAPRGERLAALAAALAAAHAAAARPPPPAERARVAEVLLALRSGHLPGPAVSPALARLCRERLAP